MPDDSVKLTILDYSDREFLLLLHDVADGDGYAESDAMAAQLGVKRHNISSRLSWLARWGAVEKEHARDAAGNIRTHRNGKVMTTQRWKLTKAGHALAFGSLKKGQRASLDKLDDTQLLDVTRWLSERTRGESTTTRLAVREWRYGHAPGR